MRRKKLFPRIVGMTALAAMLATSVMPAETFAAGEAEAKSETVTGSVPEAQTEKVPEATGKVYHVDSNTTVEESERDGTEAKPLKHWQRSTRLNFSLGTASA